MPFATAIPREKARARASIADPDATVMCEACNNTSTHMYVSCIYTYIFIYIFICIYIEREILQVLLLHACV